MRKDQLSINIPKRWLRRAVIALAVGMLVLPAAAWAGHQFTDVPDDDSAVGIFHDDIEWMADNGVTRGCNPNDNPPNTEYCPDRDLDRKEMAAFLHRLETEDVFVTPDEHEAMVDARTHFAVIDDDGTTIASNGLASSDNTAAGTYVLDFGDDVSECSWTGAVGDRDGTPVDNHVVTLNADATDTGVIHALVTDGDQNLIDEDFNVTVNC